MNSQLERMIARIEANDPYASIPAAAKPAKPAKQDWLKEWRNRNWGDLAIITLAQHRKLVAQYRKPDQIPVVKLFTPDAQCTWLLCDVDPNEPDYAFGLCDLGMGYPELGYVDLSEVSKIRGPLGLPVERDRYCNLNKPISVYAEKARVEGRITL